MSSIFLRFLKDNVAKLSVRRAPSLVTGQRGVITAALTLGAALVLLWSYLLAYGVYVLAHWVLS